MRTYMLVCLGSCVVMMTGQNAYALYQAGDPTRLGAQVVSGIGFLGAGTIVVTRYNQIKGLTTAAGLWTTTGVGMAIGCGMYAPGITATALMLIAQVLLRGVERREKMQVTELVVGLTDGKGDLVRLYDWLEQRKITVREIDLKRQEGSSVKIVLYIAMPRHFDKADFLRLQEDIPGVQSVEI